MTFYVKEDILTFASKTVRAFTYSDSFVSYILLNMSAKHANSYTELHHLKCLPILSIKVSSKLLSIQNAAKTAYNSI